MSESTEAKITTPVAIIIAGVVVALALFAGNYFGDNTPSPADPNNNGEAGIALENMNEVTEEDYIRGSADAQVTIVEYSDLECPFCKNFHETMNQVVSEYEPDEVAWVFRHFPLDTLHRKARQEAIAAECVGILGGDEAFWAYIDRIFETTTSNDGLNLDLLPQFATEVGIEATAFNTCIEGDEAARAVQDDVDNAIAAGGRGTPFSILVTADGQTVELGGAVPYENLKQGIDSILAGEDTQTE